MQRLLSTIFVTTFLIFFISPQELLAEGSKDLPSLTAEKINPGSSLYAVKRAWEKIGDFMTFSKAKRIKYNEELLKRRLIELDYVTQNQLLGEVERSSQRFIVFSAKLTENLSANGKSDDKQRVIGELLLYRKYLITFRDRFPADSSYWRLVQYDIDTIDGLLPSLR